MNVQGSKDLRSTPLAVEKLKFLEVKRPTQCPSWVESVQNFQLWNALHTHAMCGGFCTVKQIINMKTNVWIWAEQSRGERVCMSKRAIFEASKHMRTCGNKLNFSTLSFRIDEIYCSGIRHIPPNPFRILLTSLQQRHDTVWYSHSLTKPPGESLYTSNSLFAENINIF